MAGVPPRSARSARADARQVRFLVRKKKFSKKISSRVVKFIDRQEDFIILVSPARACRPSGHRVEGENSE
jgi:hypothetical protein